MLVRRETEDDLLATDMGAAEEHGARTMKVAVLGCGSSARRWSGCSSEQADDLAARVGAPVELVGIAVRRLDAPREVDVARGPAHHRRRGAGRPRRRRRRRRGHRRHRAGPDADPVRARARRLASSPPTRRCSPRTAPTLFAAADKAGRDLYYEAAVAGAIPILRPLRESLAGDQVTRVLGIVNGTTNFILDKMDTTGAGFAEALEEAQALGYAEADPTADVEGFDAAAKAAILASPGLPHPGDRRRRPPRGHHRGDRRRRRRRPARWAAWSSCWRSAELRRADGETRSRARAPGDDPAAATRWPSCATPSTRSSSSPRRPAS